MPQDRALTWYSFALYVQKKALQRMVSQTVEGLTLGPLAEMLSGKRGMAPQQSAGTSITTAVIGTVCNLWAY